jgi:hypothetical protein
VITVLLVASIVGCAGLIWGPPGGFIEILSATVAIAPILTLALMAIGVTT